MAADISDLDIFDLDEHDVRMAAAAVPVPLRQVMPYVSRMFRISSMLAPGLILIGGELALKPEAARAYGAPTLSATGTGLTLTDALTTLLGEAAELLSQFEAYGDDDNDPSSVMAYSTDCGPFVGGWIDAALAQATDRRSVSWVTATDVSNGLAVQVPADLCLRRDVARRAIEPVGALSSGCAAGLTSDAAKLRAILELVERDAAALWWYGGRPGRVLTPDDPLFQHASQAFGALRQGQNSRVFTCIDLTTDLDVPVFAAVSMDWDGHGFACGLGCRLNAADALSAAIREVSQMELSAPLAAMKRDVRGEEALNEADRRHLRRAAFDARACPLLTPLKPSLKHSSQDLTRRQAETPMSPDRLITQLSHHGIGIAVVDLTRRAFGVPVFRALSPQLQPFVPAPLTGRMQRAMREFGGGAQHTRGVPLI
jgi:thiazole/oxazole-forming peptide maturase SagD family component